MSWRGRLRLARCRRTWRRLLDGLLRSHPSHPSHPPDPSLRSHRSHLPHPGVIRTFLEAGVPPSARAAADLPALAVDLETTGLDPRRHRIVSVAWVALDTDLHLSTARHYLLREAQGGGEAVHGILHGTRAKGASLDRVLADFLQAATGRVLVAHHLEVETGFLEAAIRRSWGLDLPLVGVDTLALERRLERGAPNGGLPDDTPGAFRLPAVRTRYGLPAYPLHDALSDALAAGELFLAQRARLMARRGALTLGDLA